MNTQLTVIIPAFNEINSIEQLLIKVLNNKIDKQIIVVDDYSSDGTRELLINKFINKVDKIIFHQKNLGKGAAIKSAQNQLERFQNLGILDLPDSHPSLPKLPIWDDPKTGSIKLRANAYLDANCAHCHREQGSAKNSGLYLTYNETNMRRRGVFKPPVAAGKGSGNLEYSIVPGNPEESILIYRMKNNDPAIRMPEIGRVSAHKEGIALIEQYIRSLADH